MIAISGYEDAVEIGRGGFGVVYRARQIDVQRTVAIKVVTGTFDERARLRFDRERDALGLLSSHPHIVTVHGSGFTADGTPYIVMEYLQGASLADRLVRGPIPWEEAAVIGVKLAGALEAAHRAGVLHRDVKPENVLVSAYGEPKLADFGIARLEGGPETRSGTITASLFHAAPEVFEGERPSPATDVYSLASTVFTLIASRPPFARETDESIVPLFARVATEPVPDLRPLGVPDAVCAALEDGMAKDPVARIASPREFGTRLQEAQRANGIDPTRMIGTDGPVASPAPRRAVPLPTPRRDATAPRETPVPPTWLEPRPSGPASVPTPVGSPTPGGRRRALWGVVAVVTIGVVVGAFVLSSRGDDSTHVATSSAPTGVPCRGAPPRAVSHPIDQVWHSHAARPGGSVLASPVVLDGAVVTATDRGVVTAFEAVSGSRVAHGRLDGPVVADGAGDATAAFFATTAGGLYRFEPKSERKAVRRVLHVDRPLGAVAILDDRAYVARLDDGGGLLVVDLRRSRIVRTIATRGPVLGRPAVDLDRKAVFFADRSGVVRRLDATSGDVSRSQAPGRVEAGPALTADRLVVATVDGTVEALEPATLRLLWRRGVGTGRARSAGVYTTPAAGADGTVVATADCRIVGFDVSGGRTWEQPYPAMRAAPVAVGPPNLLGLPDLVGVAGTGGRVDVLELACGKVIRSLSRLSTAPTALAGSGASLEVGGGDGVAAALHFDPPIGNDACR